MTSCDPVLRRGDPGYAVTVETNFDTGKTIVPGTGNKTATADATAVVRPQCAFDADSDDVELTCDGEEIEIDPDDDDIDLDPADLFDVVLVD